MKANELMIGDWVRKLESGGHTIPVRVTGIIDEDSSVLFERRDCVHGVIDIKGIEPIPLTKEILEKNGFVDMDGGQYRWFSSDDECYYFGFSSIYYYPHSKFLNVTKEHQSGNQQQVKGYYEYVQGLQHAIKFCGIDKEIEL